MVNSNSEMRKREAVRKKRSIEAELRRQQLGQAGSRYASWTQLPEMLLSKEWIGDLLQK